MGIPPANLNPCDVLLYHGRGTISKLIRLFDGADVSHAGLYLGDGTVGEALGSGLERRPLATSIDGRHNDWVLARRMAAAAPSMQPVLARAEAFLHDGRPYAYEQIVLLAFLGTSRRLAVTNGLGALLRRVLDGAAEVMERFLVGKREPMICSEFVYRCYDEAVPNPCRIEIDLGYGALAAVPAGAAMGAQPAGAGSPAHRAAEAGSLLAAWQARGPVLLGPPGAFAAPLPPALPLAPGELDALAETYIAEVEAAGPAGTGGPAPLDAVGSSLVTFATAVSRSRPAAGAPPGAMAMPILEPEAMSRYGGAIADFVTPGDLLRSPSFGTLGKL
jgi:hypothetical protein